MQLPAAFVDALALKDRVRLNLEPDHVEVRPGDRASDERGARAEPRTWW